LEYSSKIRFHLSDRFFYVFSHTISHYQWLK
jgi:hypothetical protein